MSWSGPHYPVYFRLLPFTPLKKKKASGEKEGKGEKKERRKGHLCSKFHVFFVAHVLESDSVP